MGHPQESGIGRPKGLRPTVWQLLSAVFTKKIYMTASVVRTGILVRLEGDPVALTRFRVCPFGCRTAGIQSIWSWMGTILSR